jgi:hypothetical protein
MTRSVEGGVIGSALAILISSLGPTRNSCILPRPGRAVPLTGIGATCAADVKNQRVPREATPVPTASWQAAARNLLS